MKTIQITRYGPPEVLQERDSPSPTLAAGQLRIGVEATGVNFADLLQRLGLYGNAPPRPYVPGFEVAGTVLEAGPSVTDREVGERVVSMTHFGGYAEEVVVDAAAVRRIPEQMSFESAAALPVNYLTAWFCLVVMGRLHRRERVLIQTGAGGVGIAAVQIAFHLGAEIFATTGSPEKVAFLKSIGVDHPIDYLATDFRVEVERIAGRRNIDLVLDTVGGATLAAGSKLLRPLGRLVSYGLSAAAGSRRNLLRTALAWWRTPHFSPLSLIQHNIGVYGFHLALLRSREREVAEAFDQILRLCVEGAVKPIVAATFPFTATGAADAHRFLHERRNIGKVVLVH